MGEIMNCTAAGSRSFKVRGQIDESTEAGQQIQRQAKAMSKIPKNSRRPKECYCRIRYARLGKVTR